MPKAKKAARNISVRGVKFRWRATGNDGWISLTIWPAELPGATIACTLDYDQTLVPRAEDISAVTRQVVVTNRLVRQVIELAMTRFAYEPAKQGPQLNLRQVDKMIDMSNAVRAD